MKFAYDVPGYVQGHRFSDDSMYYDSNNQRFTDLAGGDRFNQYVSKITGTPVFANRGSNNQRGLYLDNTNQWQFPHACPWDGSILIVAEFSMITNQTMYPWLFGEATSTLTNDPFIVARSPSGSNQLWIQGGAAQLSQQPLIPNNQIIVFATTRGQDDRIARYSRDGVTVTATAAYSTARTDGNFIGMGGQPRVRLGALDGTNGTTPSTIGTLHVFEQHFFKTNILRDHLADTKAFIDTLKSYYAIA